MTLEGAQVVASSAQQEAPRIALSDRNGQFAVSGVAGRVTLSASRLGYTTVARTVDLRDGYEWSST